MVAAIVWSAPAFADVISDEQAVCRDKAKGDACTVGDQEGHCQDSSCSRRDYTNGPPGKMVNVPCVVCAPGAAASKPEGKTDAKTGGKSEATPPVKTQGKRGCSVGAGPATLGSVLFGVALLVLARRRRATPTA